MKKTFSYLLVFVLLFALVPFSALQVSAATYDLLFPVNNGAKIAYVYGYSAAYGDVHHDGIDIHAYGDDTIYAVADGTVGATADNCFHVNYGGPCEHYLTFGNYVRIDHADGTSSYYGHLFWKSIRVKKGDTVKKGQPIATMGSSGYSTGKHLHFELRVGSKKINVNPVSKGGNINYSSSGYIKPTFSVLANGSYVLKNNSNGKYLAVEGNQDVNAQNVKTATFNNTDDFLMNFTSATQGYKIRPNCSASRLINSYGTTVQSGNNVNIWNDEEDSSEWWGFEKVNGGYVIRNIMNPNCVLDVQSDGNVVVSAYTGANTQIWSVQNVVSYDLNMGNGEAISEFKNYGNNYYITTDVPERSGYNFLGWSLSVDSNEISYESGDSYTANKNLNLYAVWEENPQAQFKKGDVNADGETDSVDYLLVKRHCFKTYILNDEEFVRADVDDSDVIDSADYLLVKRICFKTYSV